MNICYFTFLYVLILVKGDKGVILAKTTEGVDEMGAEVGVDVLRRELCITLQSANGDRGRTWARHDLFAIVNLFTFSALFGFPS